MPKTKPSSRQSTLFRREVPQMPDGYYSSGPNPNLRRFVEEHSHAYDPVADDYNVPPFDKAITTTKATAIYNMHTYWSKKPHDAIRQYIQHYTQPGDLVLDPFCGSGGTALAALMEGRAAVAIDLSPAATFITKNYCTPVDVDELQRAFEELKAMVKPEMDWLYETRCDRCDGRATTAYTVYSYVFECPRCLSKFPLFDCVEVKNDADKPVHACPVCHERGIFEEISTRRTQRFDPVIVLVSYLCEEGCKPQRGERRHNDKDPKKRSFFEKYDLGKLAEIERKVIPYWHPPHRMMNNESDTERWGDKWRAGTSNFRTVAELFTKRNLWALARINAASLENEKYRDILRFALTAILFNCSVMYRYRDNLKGGFQMGTFYLPQEMQIINVWRAYTDKITDLTKGVIEIPCQQNLLVSTQSAMDISQIPDNSIDLIFTDPPYAEKIQYGELNFIWEAWLNLDTKWHKQEIIVNETRGKTNDDWARMMLQAMNECYRVVKPGRWVSLCYHDTSEGTWQLIQDLMAEIGFISEQTESAIFIDTGQKSYNQQVNEKVTKRDLVINFRKPRLGEVAAKMIITGEEDERSFFDKARLILVNALDAHTGMTADRLYDELVSRMVRRGEFERHNFNELLRSVAEESNGRWYLLDTAGLVDEAESKNETSAAKRLEGFMLAHLKSSGEPGVHYSDLFEQYLPIADKPRRTLIDWLPEFFYKTEQGTWRPPKDDEDRQAKLGLRSSGVLRRIKRFVNALQEGAPPSERDKPANAATLADWIYQCRRAGLYELGRVLYEKGGLRFDGLSEEAQMQADEDYQICTKRSDQRGVKKAVKGKGKKGKSPDTRQMGLDDLPEDDENV